MKTNAQNRALDAAYVAGWVLAALFWVAMLTAGFWAIWTENPDLQGKLANTAFLMFFISAIGTAAMAIWKENR